MNNYEKSLEVLDKYFAEQEDINYCAKLLPPRAGYLTQVLSTSFEEILGTRSYFVAYLLSEDSEAFMIEVYPQICCRGEGRARMTEYIARINSKVWDVNFRLGDDSSVRATITQSIHDNPVSEDIIEYLYARVFSALYVHLRNLETLSRGGLIDPDKDDEEIIRKLVEIEKRKREKFLERMGMRVPKEIMDINRRHFGGGSDDEENEGFDEDRIRELAEQQRRFFGHARKPDTDEDEDDIDETIDFVFNSLGDDTDEVDDEELPEFAELEVVDDEDDDEDDDDVFDDDDYDDADFMKALLDVRRKLLEELAQLEESPRNIGSLRPGAGRPPLDDELMDLEFDDPDADLPF